MLIGTYGCSAHVVDEYADMMATVMMTVILLMTCKAYY